jgi:hypothetical protein
MVAERSARLGVRFGVLVGSTAWIVVLGVLCAATGRTEYLLPVVLPLLLASLGLGLLALAGIEPLSRVPRLQQTSCRTPIVLGAIFVLGGVLLLLAEGFVMPVLATDPVLADVVRATGGVLEMPRWVAGGALAAGVAALIVGLRRTPPLGVSAEAK